MAEERTTTRTNKGKVCKGPLIKEVDQENRKRAMCIDCSVRIPLGGSPWLKKDYLNTGHLIKRQSSENS